MSKKEKKPDNPLFDWDREKHEEYTKGLEKQVEIWRKLNPEKYLKAQLEGEIIMKSDYKPLLGRDVQGEKIQAKEALELVKLYGFRKEELSEQEVFLLNEYYGDIWKKD